MKYKKNFWFKYSKNREFHLNSFRNTKQNNIFTTWSPYSRGLTFYAFLVNYCVIDYRQILTITKKYLKSILEKKYFDKIFFIEFEKFNFKKDYFKGSKFDLFINSDSFHEIEPKIIHAYLSYFKNLSTSFYIKNAIGKYRPTDLINHLSKKSIPKFNLKLGLIKDKINLFDNKLVKLQIKKYNNKYNPDKKYFKAFFEHSEIYPITLHSLFKRKR